jgi:hypothetical protein
MVLLKLVAMDFMIRRVVFMQEMINISMLFLVRWEGWDLAKKGEH